MYLLKGMFPLIFVLFYASETMAYTPENLDVKIGEVPSRGRAGNITGNFTLTNITRAVLVVEYQDQRNPDYRFKVQPSRLVLKPGQTAKLSYNGAILDSGKFQVMFNFNIRTSERRNAGQFEFPQYFKVQKENYQVSDYKSLYMNPRQSDELGQYFVEKQFNGDIPMARNEYETKLPSVEEMLKLDRRSLYKIPTNSGMLDDRDPRVIIRSRLPVDEMINDILPETELEALPLRAVEKVNHTFTGRFSYRGMDGQLHPAFGWRVQALRKGIFGGWSVETSDWVEFNGTWRLNVSQGGDYRFRYVAANRFFSPMDEDENIYRWIGPVRSNISTTHNEGHRYADLDQADVRGLGEVYREGMILWSKLYWEGEINPIRDQTIKFFYPNTFQTCSSSRTTPWSCASKDGKIWLIPAHASRFGVTTHELAHQIHYEFWNDSLPSGSGGPHNLVNCFNKGLSLTEGFANFMMFWAHQDRSQEPSSGFDFNAETPPSNFCTNPLSQNESWVAAAFWDLHDTRTDGDDRLWFIHKGSVPAIFLRNGVQHSMDDFHSIYRNRANSAHSHHIDNIFEQNNIIN